MYKSTFAGMVATFAAIVALIACPIESNAENLNPDQAQQSISNRFTEIYERYEPGDIITGDDADFIKAHAEIANAPSTRAQDKVKAFQRTESKYGTEVRFNGKMWHQGTFEYNYGGNLQATLKSGPTPKKMTMSVNCQAYGLVADGYVVTYEGSVTHTANGVKSTSMNKSKNYTGVVALYYVNATLDVTTAGGQGFNIVVT